MGYQNSIPNDRRTDLAALATSNEVVYSVLATAEHERPQAVMSVSRALIGLPEQADINELPPVAQREALYIMRTLRDHIAELGGAGSPWRKRTKICATRTTHS